MTSLVKRAVAAVRGWFGWPATPQLQLPRTPVPGTSLLFAVLAHSAAVRRHERRREKGPA